MRARSRSIGRAVACAFVLALVAVPASAAERAGGGASDPPAAPRSTALTDTDRNHIADGLDRRLARSEAGGRRDVVVTFDARASMRAALRAIPHSHRSTTFSLIDGFAARLTENQIRSLAHRPGVIRVEQDFEVHALDDAANDSAGVTTARTSFGTTGAGVTVCIPDSGVDLGHEQLDSKAPIPWLDLIGGHQQPYDDMGHGTHVASIAVGDGVGAGPIVGRMRGVAPGASLAAVKVLDATGFGDDSLAVQGVEWCAGIPGVDVISLSLGSDVPSDGLDAMSQAVDAATADRIVVVAAAGNSGDLPRSITAPGSALTAITVGATAEWGGPPSAPYFSEGPYLAAFSSRGPTADGRIKPDVVAPGVTIGAGAANTTASYVAESGTSMATPFVAGTAALIRELQPSWTPAQVRAAIEGTAHDAGPAGKDADWGAGILDAYGAVATAAGATGRSAPFPVHERFTGTVSNDGQWTKTFTLKKAQLGAPVAATVTLDGDFVCVIDLGPLGCFQYGWHPDLEASLSGPGFTTVESTCPAGEECVAGHQEILHLTPTLAGIYTLRVYPAADGDGTGGSFAIDLFHGALTGNAAPAVHVGDLDGTGTATSAKRWLAQATVEVHDKAHAPVAGALVTGLWTGSTAVSCVTNAAGRCTVSKSFPRSRAQASFTVSFVRAAGFAFKSSASHDADGDSNGKKITVLRPA